LETYNLAGTGITIITLLCNRKCKAHLVNVATLDQLIEVTASSSVRQPSPHEHPLIVRDKLQRLISSSAHDHDIVRVVVFERHVLEISSIQRATLDDLVVFHAIDLVHNGRLVIYNRPPFDD